MEYRYLSQEEVGFLSSIFVTPEYDLYFAENDTTEQEWKERCSLFDVEHSYIISKNNMDIGWIMYTLRNNICELDIVVLLPTERYKGYGKEIFSDLLSRHPQINTIKLDVQQRNKHAIEFYTKMGFRIISEELQPVNGEATPYYNMILNVIDRS